MAALTPRTAADHLRHHLVSDDHHPLTAEALRLAIDALERLSVHAVDPLRAVPVVSAWDTTSPPYAPTDGDCGCDDGACVRESGRGGITLHHRCRARRARAEADVAIAAAKRGAA